MSRPDLRVVAGKDVGPAAPPLQTFGFAIGPMGIIALKDGQQLDASKAIHALVEATEALQRYWAALDIPPGLFFGGMDSLGLPPQGGA